MWHDRLICCGALVCLAATTRWQMVKDAPVKGPWSPEEDALLKVLVEEYGSKKW